MKRHDLNRTIAAVTSTAGRVRRDVDFEGIPRRLTRADMANADVSLNAMPTGTRLKTKPGRGRELLKVNLKRAMARTGDVTEISRLSGIPAIELYQALAGELSPSVDWLGRVAAALGIPVHELLRPR